MSPDNIYNLGHNEDFLQDSQWISKHVRLDIESGLKKTPIKKLKKKKSNYVTTVMREVIIYIGQKWPSRKLVLKEVLGGRIRTRSASKGNTIWDIYI